ncbi:MAG: four helix bundle protein [Candidatus Saccharimonadales bacterium]
MKQESSIKDFTDLTTWQKGHELVLTIYKLTIAFPDTERFGLMSQMRRSAVSITSNIAEGFSRRSFIDKKHFYVMAHGSLTELQNQLLIARDVEYISENDFKQTADLAVIVHKMLNGLIKSTSNKSMIHDS